MGLIQNKVTVSQPNSHVVVKNAGGLRGLTGEQGVPGAQGEPGQAATITVGTTTTLPAGSAATVQNVGSTSAAIFNFGIPKGDKGDTGESGAAATISVGSTSTLPAGSSATVTNSGTSSAAVFDFGIPKGDKGDTGATGADGYSPSATVTKTGDTATITITDKDGTTTAQISDGSTPTVNDGTLTIQKNGTTVQTFSADQASNVTANITVPTQFSELSGTVSSSQIEDEAITTGSVSGTGTNITLAGTMEGGAIESIELNGDTEQTTYSGKNLLKNLTNLQADNGVAATLQSDGQLKVAGTVGSEWNGSTISSYTNNPLTAGTYTFSIDHTISVPITVSCRNSSNQTVAHFAISAGSTSATVALDQDIARTSLWLNVSTGTAVNFTVKAQLEKNSSATSFEPYVGGTASPNPDYPQEVQTVTGEQSIEVHAKNLFDKDNANILGAYIGGGTPHTIDIDGSNTSVYIPCQPNTTYTISKVADNVFRVGTTAETPASGVVVNDYVDNYGGSTITLTSSSNAKYIVVFLRNVSSSHTQAELLASLQIEKGSSATTYEPYKGVTKTVNLGKNLLDKSSASASLEGYFNNAKVSLNADTRMAYIPCLQNTTYTVSKIGSKRFAVATTTVVPDAGVAVSGFISDNTGTSITITTGSSAKYLCVFYYLSTSDTLTPQEVLDTLQIEKGSTATTYAPYFTPIELCKIGTYQDYIYKSGEDWYIKKYVGKLVFTGTEQWERNVFAGKYYFTHYQYLVGQQYGWSNYFGILTVGGPLTSNVNVIRASQGRIDLIMDGSELSLDDFKSWLSSHNTSYYYFLETPTDTQITNATLISELEGLLSATTYSGTTYITVSGDLASPLEVVAEADSKLAPDSVYGAAIKDGAVSVDKIADLKALADALAPYLNS